MINDALVEADENEDGTELQKHWVVKLLESSSQNQGSGEATFSAKSVVLSNYRTIFWVQNHHDCDVSNLALSPKSGHTLIIIIVAIFKSLESSEKVSSVWVRSIWMQAG